MQYNELTRRKFLQNFILSSDGPGKIQEKAVMETRSKTTAKRWKKMQKPKRSKERNKKKKRWKERNTKNHTTCTSAIFTADTG